MHAIICYDKRRRVPMNVKSEIFLGVECFSPPFFFFSLIPSVSVEDLFGTPFVRARVSRRAQIQTDAARSEHPGRCYWFVDKRWWSGRGTFDLRSFIQPLCPRTQEKDCAWTGDARLRVNDNFCTARATTSNVQRCKQIVHIYFHLPRRYDDALSLL